MPVRKTIPNEDWAALAEELIQARRLVRFRVKGISMEPWIFEGDLVEAAPAAAGELSLGDLVLYRDGRGRPILHGLIGREDGRLILSGSKGGREHVDAAQVLGRVALVKKGWRHFLWGGRQPALKEQIDHLVAEKVSALPESTKANAVHGARLWLLESLLARLKERGAEPLILRGMAFVLYLYDSPEQRPMGDIDLVVRPGDLASTQEVLAELGLDPLACGEINYVKREFMVEVNGGFWYRRDLEAVYARALALPLGPVSGLTPSPEDAFIDLAFHTVGHRGWLDARVAEDARRLLAREDFRLNEVQAQARKNRWQTILALFLEELRRAGVETPALEVPAGLGARLIRAVYRLPWDYKGSLLRVLVQPGLLGKARFAWSWLFPGRDFIARRYGPGFVWAKAALRPLLLLLKLLRTTVWDRLARLFDVKLLPAGESEILAGLRAIYESPEEIAVWRPRGNPEAEERELELLESHFKKPGKLLDIGCGAGREAILFASRGFEVTAVDPSSGMIAAASEEAAAAGVSCRFLHGYPEQLDFPTATFDYVFFDRTVYSMMPGRARRVALLGRARRWLKPGGLMTISGYERETEAWASGVSWRVRRLLSIVLGRRHHWERGDIWLRPGVSAAMSERPALMHRFRPEELREEIEEAGYSIIAGEAGDHWVARKNLQIPAP